MEYGTRLESVVDQAGKLLPRVATREFPGVEALLGMREDLTALGLQVGELETSCVEAGRTPPGSGDYYRVSVYAGQDIEQMLQILETWNGALPLEREELKPQMFRKWCELRNELAVAWTRSDIGEFTLESYGAAFENIARQNLAVLAQLPALPLISVSGLNLDRLESEIAALDESIFSLVQECARTGQAPNGRQGNGFRALSRLWNDVTIALGAVREYKGNEDTRAMAAWELLRELAELRAQAHVFLSRFTPSPIQQGVAGREENLD